MKNLDLPSLIPFLGFLGFLYVFSTMGNPGRLPGERPAAADHGGLPAAYPRCIGDRDATIPDNWQPCNPEELKALDNDRPMVWNAIKGVWE